MPKSPKYGWQKRWLCDVDAQTATHAQENIRFVFDIKPNDLWWTKHKLDLNHEPTREWIERKSQRMSYQDYQAHVRRMWYEAGARMMNAYDDKRGAKYTVWKS